MYADKSSCGRRLTMATSSIGRAIVIDDKSADIMIAAMEETEANPPKPRTREIKWADPEKVLESWTRNREHAK
jgi:hypothetical protein